MLSTSRFATRLVLTTLVAVCSPLAAGQGRWTQTGPMTAFVYSVIADPADPSVLWVSAGGGGVFRSVDGAGSWSQLFELPPKDWSMLSTRQIVVTASGQRRLWLVTRGDAIHWSEDGGASWSPVGPRPRIGDFTAHLGCGDVLLAASDGGGVWSWEPAPPRRPSGRPGLGAAATGTLQREPEP